MEKTISTRRPLTDMALDQDDVGTRFGTLVVIMMSALATIAVGGALVVDAMRASWVGAVHGHMTIEIPASDGKGAIRAPDLLDKTAISIRDALAQSDDIRNVHIMSREEVEKLIQPWLGENAGGENLPLPELIAVMLKNPDDADAPSRITQTAQALDAAAITETHKSWLSDLKRFSLVLLLAAMAMAGATIACSILTIAGAVKAQLAAHHGDIDLLHVMGATDDYIGVQFVRVVVASVGRAAIIGTVGGLILLKVCGLVAGELQSAVLPAFQWNLMALVSFAALPALITALCYAAARFTVMRTLKVMP